MVTVCRGRVEGPQVWVVGTVMPREGRVEVAACTFERDKGKNYRMSFGSSGWEARAPRVHGVVQGRVRDRRSALLRPPRGERLGRANTEWATAKETRVC
jgi:hypothetical protein